MLTEEQQKDYNIFRDLIIEVIPELLTNEIVYNEEYLKYIFLRKKNTESTPETTMWDFIYNLDKFLLEGPFFISHDKIKPLSKEKEETIKRHYNLYIKDKNEGKRNPYTFFNSMEENKNYDPRDINFETVAPIILNEDYTIYNGKHRTFLAKLEKSSIRAYRIINKPNNHPNIPKIKSYLK